MLLTDDLAVSAPARREVPLPVQIRQLQDEANVWRRHSSAGTNVGVRTAKVYVVADHQVRYCDRD